MAQNRPYGLTPLRKITGEKYNGSFAVYALDSADTSEYRPGDLVKSAGGAAVGRAVNGSPVLGVPYVEAASPGDTCRGVIVAILTSIGDLSIPYVPSVKTGTYLVGVCDDPEMVFSVQASNSSTFNLAYISGSADFAVAAPGTATTVSGTTLDYSTATSSVGDVLQILGFATNDIGAYSSLAVRIYLHELGGGSGGSVVGGATAENQDLQIALMQSATTATEVRIPYTQTTSTTVLNTATGKQAYLENDSDVVFYGRFGSGAASSTDWSFTLSPNGDAISIPQTAAGLQITGIFAAGGTTGGLMATVLS